MNIRISKRENQKHTLIIIGGWNDACDYIREKLENAQAADVAPVVHGRWTKAEDDYYGLNIVKCSVCREEWCFEVEDDVFDLNYHYCPNCGAKMDGEGEANAAK